MTNSSTLNNKFSVSKSTATQSKDLINAQGKSARNVLSSCETNESNASLDVHDICDAQEANSGSKACEASVTCETKDSLEINKFTGDSKAIVAKGTSSANGSSCASELANLSEVSTVGEGNQQSVATTKDAVVTKRTKKTNAKVSKKTAVESKKENTKSKKTKSRARSTFEKLDDAATYDSEVVQKLLDDEFVLGKAYAPSYLADMKAKKAEILQERDSNKIQLQLFDLWNWCVKSSNELTKTARESGFLIDKRKVLSDSDLSPLHKALENPSEFLQSDSVWDFGPYVIREPNEKQIATFYEDALYDDLDDLNSDADDESMQDKDAQLRKQAKEHFFKALQHGVDPAKAQDYQESTFDSKEFLKRVPNRPGCYLMYNDRDMVIYVGKAKDLQKRLSSYFIKNVNSLKTRTLVSHIHHIEFTVTFSESEALILENELIKKYQPRYNILLRDDKSYPFIRISTDHVHPGIYFHRGARNKGGEYFGPFPDSTAVRDSLRFLQKVFPIRQCDDFKYSNRTRPCLVGQMGKCLAPCVQLSEEAERSYKDQVDLVKLFLKGQNQALLDEVAAKMEEHATALEFEQAAFYRDQLTSLRHVQTSNSIISDIMYPLDVVAHDFKSGICCIHVFFIRNGRIFGTRSYFPKFNASADARDVVISFLTQFYLNDTHSGLLPEEVVVDIPLRINKETTDTSMSLSDYSFSDKDEVVAVKSNAEPSISANTVNNEQLSGHQDIHHELSQDAEPCEAGATVSATHHSSNSSLEYRNSQTAANRNAVEGHIDASHGSDTIAKNFSKEFTKNISGPAVDDLSIGTMDKSDTNNDNLSIAESEANGSSSLSAGAQIVNDTTSLYEGISLSPSEDDESNLDELKLLSEAIFNRFNKKVRFASNVRGSKARFLKLAMANAEASLKSKLSSSEVAKRRIEDLEEVLGISGIERMECYDISHSLGKHTVGSCVVFNREGPDTSQYRRYNIEGITPGDDYAAMDQVLSRRFRHPDEGEVPQIVFIDGGKGQLGRAEEALEIAFKNAKTPKPLIIAVTKGEKRKLGLETLVKGYSREEIDIDPTSPAFLLALHIRDESHRFAITGHRNKRDKVNQKSPLDEIPGLGPKRRQALLKSLGGMVEVRSASVDELSKVKGISKEMAQQIYDALHN